MNHFGRYGLSLANRGVMFGATTPAELVALGEQAEQSGVFDSVWVGDSILAKPRVDSIVLLAAVAARTSKVTLGPACFASFPLRHPISLAYQWASLDLLSGGRTVMVACIGGGTKSGAGEFDTEYAAFQADPRQRAARMEEGIEILRNLWTQEVASHDGRFFHYEAVRMGPKPVQQPCPPIWVTANPHSVGVTSSAAQRRLFQRVARLGDGWMTAGVTPEEFATDLREIHRCLGEIGKDSDQFPSSIHYMINVDENRKASLQEHKAFLREYYSFDWPQDKLDRMTAFGAPQECAEKLQAYFDRGLTTICLRFTSWNQREQVRRFVERVAPLLH